MGAPRRIITSIYVNSDRKVRSYQTGDEMPTREIIFAVTVLDNRSFGRYIRQAHEIANTVGYVPPIS